MRSYREVEHRFASAADYRKDAPSMETLIVNAIIGFWLVLFGAMAIVPFVLENKPARQPPMEDDVIISIQPVAMPQSSRQTVTPISIPTQEPDRREAA